MEEKIGLISSCGLFVLLQSLKICRILFRYDPFCFLHYALMLAELIWYWHVFLSLMQMWVLHYLIIMVLLVV